MLYIVLYHYTQRYTELFSAPSFAYSFSNGGEVGVAIFFIISGYLTMLSSSKIDSEGWSNWLKRKYLRLYPQYIIAVILCFSIVGYFGLSNREFTLIDLGRDAFMLPLISARVDHAHWYVTALVGFYIFFLILYKLKLHKNIWTYITILLINAISYVASLMLDGKLPEILSLMTTFFINAKPFLGGAILVLYKERKKGFLYVVLAYSIYLNFLNYKILPFEIIFLIMIFEQSFGLYSFLNKILATNILLIVGKYSFMWYLVHQNIGYVVMNQMCKYPINYQFIPYITAFITFIMAVLCMEILDIRKKNKKNNI